MRTLSVKRRNKDGPAISLRLDTPVDGAKPFEVYGFAGSIGSLVAFAVYIFWAYLPESWLHALGITYYPSRYWAVAIPSYLMVMIIFMLTLYTSLNFISTPPLESLSTLFDDHTLDPSLSSPLDGEECPIIHPYSDMPIIEANALLLGPAFEQGSQRGYSRDESFSRHVAIQGGVCQEPMYRKYYATDPLYNPDTPLRSTRQSTTSSTVSYVMRENQQRYLRWCTVRIQAWWRGVSCRKRFRHLRVAAKIIQAAWRGYMMTPREKRKECKPIILPVFLAATKKTYEITPVVKIQRCWRSYQDVIAFEGVRDLIHSYEKADPRTILLRINRSEATLVDKAAGLHVRFRLSGLSFPPMVLYKVYTHRPVVDMGSFSPRQYSGGKNYLAKTYIRCENNGWRPVIGTPAEQTGPKVVLQVPDHGGFFSNSLEERRILKALELKKRKRAWLRKLYIEGRAAESNKASATESVDGTRTSEPDLEDLELMRWSAGLDFDEFERDWFARATSLPEVYDQDWHKLGTCLPVYNVQAHTMPIVEIPSVFY